jgi:hypothetical protein
MKLPSIVRRGTMEGPTGYLAVAQAGIGLDIAISGRVTPKDGRNGSEMTPGT